MLTFANDMESNQIEQLYKMMSIINEAHYERKRPYHRRYHSKPNMRDYDQNMYNYDMDPKMYKFKIMLKITKMMNAMKKDDSFMSEKMMQYGDMENRYYYITMN